MKISSQRFRVINQRDQPVELHCGGRVVILASRAAAELSGSEVSEPQLVGLERRGLLAIRALPKPPEAQSAEAKKPARKPRSRVAKRTSTKKSARGGAKK